MTTRDRDMAGGGAPPIRIPGSTPSWAAAERFYSGVTIAAGEAGGHRVLLDDRLLRTPAKRILELPTAKLAEAVAAEWRAQGPQIDPRTMPLTRLVNSAIDGVASRVREVADDIARYAASDHVCYRADHPAELVQCQAAAWDPLLDWAAERLGGRLAVSIGIVHIAQDPALIARLASRAAALPPLRLAALHVMTTLTGSAVIALAHAEGHVDADRAWAAAHVDEDWQIAQWGEDAEAHERRRQRRVELDAASRLYALGA